MPTYRKSDLLEVIEYSDYDYNGFLDCPKSTSGYVFMLARGAISWKSSKQSLIALSIIEDEFVACSEASNHALWLRNFISRIRIVDLFARLLKIYCDNTLVVSFLRMASTLINLNILIWGTWFLKESRNNKYQLKILNNTYGLRPINKDHIQIYIRNMSSR